MVSTCMTSRATPPSSYAGRGSSAGVSSSGGACSSSSTGITSSSDGGTVHTDTVQLNESPLSPSLTVRLTQQVPISVGIPFTLHEPSSAGSTESHDPLESSSQLAVPSSGSVPWSSPS